MLAIWRGLPHTGDKPPVSNCGILRHDFLTLPRNDWGMGGDARAYDHNRASGTFTRPHYHCSVPQTFPLSQNRKSINGLTSGDWRYQNILSAFFLYAVHGHAVTCSVALTGPLLVCCLHSRPVLTSSRGETQFVVPLQGLELVNGWPSS